MHSKYIWCIYVKHTYNQLFKWHPPYLFLDSDLLANRPGGFLAHVIALMVLRNVSLCSIISTDTVHISNSLWARHDLVIFPFFLWTLKHLWPWSFLATLHSCLPGRFSSVFPQVEARAAFLPARSVPLGWVLGLNALPGFPKCPTWQMFRDFCTEQSSWDDKRRQARIGTGPNVSRGGGNLHKTSSPGAVTSVKLTQ